MLDALDEQLDPVLRLPVGGVDVLVPYPNIRVGLRCKRFYADLLAGRSAEALNPAALLLQDPPAIPPLDLERCAWTAMAYFGAGPEAAERLWTGQKASPKAAEPELLDGPYGPYDPAPGAYGEDDPGGGPYNPTTGLRDWYDDAPAPKDRTAALSWSRLLAHWPAVVCDFQQHYNVDLDDVLDRRHIGWFETRLAGLQDIAGSRIQLLTLTKED
ncbi:hypothetical protein AXK57_19705 [Tsukamurella pulmonis]|uniref:hypothetical protein n=1 Tax=Tsukamurella pulmonis TaxID=47312 RepID=UPI0007977573|nr:hypothetical protein [Tsukamurella pulmonis]KXP12177.1 hypothetical protein AXK57_19705 [Tsukamurella pulmonis]